MEAKQTPIVMLVLKYHTEVDFKLWISHPKFLEMRKLNGFCASSSLEKKKFVTLNALVTKTVC